MWAVNSNVANKKILAGLSRIEVDQAKADKLQHVYDTVAMTRVELFQNQKEDK